jgi:hypothetical protein
MFLSLVLLEYIGWGIVSRGIDNAVLLGFGRKMN